jgi:hypothetical protein
MVKCVLCVFGHWTEVGEECEECVRRRMLARKRLGYPPYGELPPFVPGRRYDSDDDERSDAAAIISNLKARRTSHDTWYQHADR